MKGITGTNFGTEDLVRDNLFNFNMGEEEWKRKKVVFVGTILICCEVWEVFCFPFACFHWFVTENLFKSNAIEIIKQTQFM